MIKKLLHLTSWLILIGCTNVQTFKNIQIKEEINKSYSTINVLMPQQILKINNVRQMENIKNRSYRLYFTLNECHGELLVDNVPVYQFLSTKIKKGYPSGAIGINQVLLKTGKHFFTVKMYPPFGKTTLEKYSYGEVKAFYMNVDNYDQQVDMCTVASSTEGKGLEGLPYYEINGEIDVALPFNIEGWTNSVNLKEEMDKGINLKNEIQLMYDSIINIITTKNTTRFKQLVQEREDLLGTAFYFDQGKKQKEMAEFLDVILNKDYELASLPSEVKLHFYANGKLATLLTPEKDGVIKLVNKKDPADKIIFEFRFHRKKKGDKLTVI